MPRRVADGKLTREREAERGPAALARVSAAHKAEETARQTIEATARANFAAQAQTHEAVIELLDARNHADLARRIGLV